MSHLTLPSRVSRLTLPSRVPPLTLPSRVSPLTLPPVRQVLLSSLSPERDVLCLKLGLRSLTSVGLDGGRLCRILVGQGAAGRLVALVAGRRRQVRPQALRALATLCCVSQGIKAFEKVSLTAEVLIKSQSRWSWLDKSVRTAKSH